MAAIEAADLRRTYKTHTGTVRRRSKEIEAVRGISFAVEPGELFGLLGPNGAGKTTTIKMLITLLIPTGGSAVPSNVIFGFLLIFTGANVPLGDLPDWMSTAALGMPFTHAIAAARKLADGASLGDVSGLLGAELLVGGIAGFLLLRWFETLSRRYASLERS